MVDLTGRSGTSLDNLRRVDGASCSLTPTTANAVDEQRTIKLAKLWALSLALCQALRLGEISCAKHSEKSTDGASQ